MEFFSRDAGQARRNALQNALAGLTDYIPPELRPWLGVANELNPVTSLERAGTNALAVADPNVQGWDKVAAVGDMTSNMANALAPVVLGSSGAVPAANAVEEALMGFSAASPMAYAARDFVTDEFGGVGFGDEVASRGAQIMDMLRSGRGADVTDEMLDMGDPTLNARLNEWLFNNYDLPMDAASRSARAVDVGMSDGVYRGMGPSPYDLSATTPDPQSLRVSEWGKLGQAVSTSPSADIASQYAQGGAVSPLVTNASSFGSVEDYDAAVRAATNGRFVGAGPQSRMATEAMRSSGFDGVSSPQEVAIYDPRNIRSRFARFDPRLSHLRNLSAVGAGLAIYEEQQREEAAREYLRSIGAL